jgi:hypothetical protein
MPVSRNWKDFNAHTSQIFFVIFNFDVSLYCIIKPAQCSELRVMIYVEGRMS